jgi:hypothetical protein
MGSGDAGMVGGTGQRSAIDLLRHGSDLCCCIDPARPGPARCEGKKERDNFLSASKKLPYQPFEILNLLIL